MIDRYQTNEMEAIFNDEFKFSVYLKVELASVEAFNKLGVVPDADLNRILSNAKFDLNGIKILEEVTHHDVVAFTRNVSSFLGDEKKWIHYGLTSSDVVDTANGYIYRFANEFLNKALGELKDAIKEKANKYKYTPCIGRTHGVHADITTFGLKWALYFDELSRDYGRFLNARKDIEVGKISGAVGNYANVDPFVQDYVCEKLSLGSSKISTQVLQRDRHAYYASTLTLISCLLEKIALEIRNLQRTEILECEEYFDISQIGSSAMPHKRNPIASENICGCARLMRGYLLPIFEDIALFHERDISHSSVERVALVDSISLLHYMIKRMTKIIKSLVVYPDTMLKNISLTHNVIFSQRVMNKLIGKGLSREEAYDLIQSYAQKSYSESIDFIELINKDKKITSLLNKKEINSCLDFEYYFKNIDLIYKRLEI